MRKTKQDKTIDKPYRLGIALGGGAARGWAHIGVLNALATRGLCPDIVAGASMGALVGAAYAADSLARLEEWSCGLTRMDVLGLLDARFRGGVFHGSRVMTAFGEQIGKHDIEALPVAYGAVACELASGREIWLQRGDLLSAVRASCAVPGLFAPTSHEGRWLIDGAVVNPVPVSLCHALGADLVIAVNLNSQMLGRHRLAHPVVTPAPAKEDTEGLGKITGALGTLLSHKDAEPGLLDVVMASVEIMQERITRSRMAGEPPYLELRPHIQHVQIMDFHRCADAIAAGRAAVVAAAPHLDELAALLES